MSVTVQPIRARRHMSFLLILIAIVLPALLLPAGAFAGEPAPFTYASAPCGEGPLIFPPQPVSHTNVVFHFRSLGSAGKIGGEWLGLEYGLSGIFAAGGSGWGTVQDVQAGIAASLNNNCTGGSIEASLAERPSTPATFSGVTSSTGTEVGIGEDRPDRSWLPFIAPGAGQYALSLSISQGAVEIEGVHGILESSGEFPLGSMSAGNHNLAISAPVDGGPPAVWSVSVRELPVVINGLTFGQTCMTPGTGLVAKFSVTGDTSIAATVVNGSGQAVRSLGTFAVKEGSGAIPWDGRGTGGQALSEGSYTLKLVSTDPQGDVTTAETPIYVATTGPAVAMTSPHKITPSESVAFSVTDAACGVKLAQVAIDGQKVGTFREKKGVLPNNGALMFTHHSGWTLGKHRWSIKATDNLGNTTTRTGTFAVVASLARAKHGRHNRHHGRHNNGGRKLRNCAVKRQVQLASNFPGVIHLQARGTGCRMANGVALVMKNAGKRQERSPRHFRLSKAYGRRQFKCTYRVIRSKHPVVDLGIEATCRASRKTQVRMHLTS